MRVDRHGLDHCRFHHLQPASDVPNQRPHLQLCRGRPGNCPPRLFGCMALVCTPLVSGPHAQHLQLRCSSCQGVWLEVVRHFVRFEDHRYSIQAVQRIAASPRAEIAAVQRLLRCSARQGVWLEVGRHVPRCAADDLRRARFDTMAGQPCPGPTLILPKPTPSFRELVCKLLAAVLLIS